MKQNQLNMNVNIKICLCRLSNNSSLLESHFAAFTAAKVLLQMTASSW